MPEGYLALNYLMIATGQRRSTKIDLRQLNLICGNLRIRIILSFMTATALGQFPCQFSINILHRIRGTLDVITAKFLCILLGLFG